MTDIEARLQRHSGLPNWEILIQRESWYDSFRKSPHPRNAETRGFLNGVVGSKSLTRFGS
jgi:hypothetical protein